MGVVLEFLLQAIFESALFLWVERWPRWAKTLLCVVGLVMLLALIGWLLLSANSQTTSTD